jgi:hypothetical protein
MVANSRISCLSSAKTVIRSFALIIELRSHMIVHKMAQMLMSSFAKRAKKASRSEPERTF